MPSFEMPKDILTRIFICRSPQGASEHFKIIEMTAGISTRGILQCKNIEQISFKVQSNMN